MTAKGQHPPTHTHPPPPPPTPPSTHASTFFFLLPVAREYRSGREWGTDGPLDARPRGEKLLRISVSYLPSKQALLVAFFSSRLPPWPFCVKARYTYRSLVGFVTRCTGSSAEGKIFFEDADRTERRYLCHLGFLTVKIRISIVARVGSKGRPFHVWWNIAHSDAVLTISTATVTEDEIKGKRDFLPLPSNAPPPVG